MGLSSDIDTKELLKKTYEIDIPEIKESEFAGIEISGDKEMLQPNGIIAKILIWGYLFQFAGLGYTIKTSIQVF